MGVWAIAAFARRREKMRVRIKGMLEEINWEGKGRLRGEPSAGKAGLRKGRDKVGLFRFDAGGSSKQPPHA